MGDESGYTLDIRNQYISYGLSDESFEMYLNFIYDYYCGFSLTPMSFTLAVPDLELSIGDRVSVYDEEEDITVTGNVSKIAISGNCIMTVTCGGYGTVGSRNYKSTSSSQMTQTGTNSIKSSQESGDTFNDAIILTQGYLPYILHSYSVVEYRRGYSIVAQGPDSSIIIAGTIAYSANALSANAVYYSSVSFAASTGGTVAPTGQILEMRINKSGRDGDDTPWNQIGAYRNGTQIRGGMDSYGVFGLALSFSAIYAPNENYPFGYAAIAAWIVYQKKDGTMYLDTAGAGGWGAVSFASLDEYHAAIRLRKTPEMGSDVIETTVKEDRNSTLEKAMLYTDTVVKSLQDSFANITDADREQIEQNASDIAAHNVRITAAEAGIDEINAPATGILPQAKNYTDFVADELRGEFGTT